MSERTPITSFSGQYRFLSNFYSSEVIYDDHIYPTVEHAYQASKTTISRRHAIRQAENPGHAKRLGRQVPLRRDFEENKVMIMRKLVRQKFKDPMLRTSLLRTGNRRLVEGNRRGDQFWGESPVGFGQNKLGQILMVIREEIREELRRG